MNRNLTPRPVRATGAKDAHGTILDPASGALYVHMHRESGLAHRHYVLKPWQVRTLAVLISRPLLIVYVLALVTWGWTASQALRVPLLQQRLGELTRDAARLDTLSVRLSQLQDRYDQVQRMLGAAARVPGSTGSSDSTRSKVAPAATKAAPAPSADTARKTAPPTTP
jgi:hypothetical protein